jgi:drug/metabolite transporter (DMT)-like permease
MIRKISCRQLGACALTLSSLLWAGNAIVGRAVRLDCDPLTLSYYRWLITALAIGLLARQQIAQDIPRYKKHWKLLLAGGLLGMALFHTLQYHALAENSATDVALIMSFTPAIVMLITAAVERKRPRSNEITGLILSVTGAALVTTHGFTASLPDQHGDRSIIALAVFCWAGYSIIARARPANLAISSMLFAMSLAATLLLTPFYVFSVFQGHNIPFNQEQILAIIYVSLFASLLAYQAYSFGIEKLGGMTAPQYLSLIPLFTALMSLLFLGEPPKIYEFLAMACIIGGVSLATIRMSTFVPLSKGTGDP